MRILNLVIYSKELDDADCAAFCHMIGKGDNE
jgi:hypothetical protein